MNTKSLSGQLVTLLSSVGPIKRVVVQDLGDVLLVCLVEEYEKAKIDAREPATIGFKRSDVVTA